LHLRRVERARAMLDQGQLIITKSNPEALWISDYEDRIIYDGRRIPGGTF
jgi:hypothetical protein